MLSQVVNHSISASHNVRCYRGVGIDDKKSQGVMTWSLYKVLVFFRGTLCKNLNAF